MNERRQSAWVKLKIMANGIQDAPEIFEQLGSFKEEHYAYDNGNWGVAANRLVPAEILLPGEIAVKVHIRPESPLRFVLEGGELFIADGNAILSPCRTLPRPKFWDFCTSQGVPTRRYANFYGKNCLNFNIFSGCQFFRVGKQCRFCSVECTQSTQKQVEIRKSASELREVCRLAVENDDVQWILITGGSTLVRSQELEDHLEVLRQIRDVLPWNGLIHGNLSMMPPADLESLKLLKEAGVEHPSFNLEVWPESAFDTFCPGKSHYVGFQHILNCYRHLVPIYGEGEVWCNFVAGLVPLEDIKAGFSFMAAMGVVPGANIYHPEVGSVLGRSIPSPDEEFIRSLYCHAGELYHKYGFKPYFDASVLRNSLANEAYEGLLD